MKKCVFVWIIFARLHKKTKLDTLHQYYNLPLKKLFELYADYDEIVNNSEYRFEFDKMYSLFWNDYLSQKNKHRTININIIYY